MDFGVWGLGFPVSASTGPVQCLDTGLLRLVPGPCGETYCRFRLQELVLSKC